MSGLDLGCIHLVRTQRGGGWYTKIIVFLFKIPTREKVEGGNTHFLAYVLNRILPQNTLLSMSWVGKK